MTPYTVIPLKMISVAKSTGTSPLGMPSSCTRPPRRTAANAWCRAEGTPALSPPPPAPSPPVPSTTVRTTSSRAALMTTCAPIVRASSRRFGFTSDAMTFAAPAARAMPTAKQPIGPHPAMNTVLPDTSAVSTAWKALPIGSITAPTVVGMPFKGSTLVAGMAMYSANAPSRSTPMMRVLRQMCPLPVRHCTQCPHTRWPSAVTAWPTLSSATPSPSATISPANSWPTTSGGLRRPCAHASQSAMWRSVPHTPACRTAMSTSPGAAEGFATVVTFRPGARFSLTIACITREAEKGKRERSEYGSREAPIYLQHSAGNITGSFGGQKRHRRGELVGASHASQRNRRHQVAHHLLRPAVLLLGARPGQLAEGRRRRAARIAEQHVQPAQLVVHPLHDPLGLRRDADVRHGGRHRLPRLGAELDRDPLDRLRVAAVHDHARAFLRQRLRDGAAEPLGAAAHQGDTAGEAEIHGAGIYRRAGTAAGSMRTAQHFSSAILAYGSSTGLVSRFAAASRKWNGTNTCPRATRSEIRQEMTSELRRDVTRARSPSSKPSAAASAGLISMTAVGSRWSSPVARRVMVPVCQWYSWRPVFITNGYASSGSSTGGPYSTGTKIALPSAVGNRWSNRKAVPRWSGVGTGYCRPAPSSRS